MRVMRVIAGNVPYNVRDMSKTNIYIGLKDYPLSPASPANERYSPTLPPAGNSHLDLSLVCDFSNLVN